MSSNADFANETSTTGLECSMEGFVELVLEITELFMSIITLMRIVLEIMLPDDLATSLKYFYRGMSGVNSWLGYGVAAVYFLAKDLGHGGLVCESMGYANVVVEGIYKMLSFFSQPGMPLCPYYGPYSHRCDT